MRKLIIISGFSRSGKTTAIDFLVNNDYYNASTSRVLGRFTEAVIKFLANETIDTDDKDASVEINGGCMTSRRLKIGIAEDCIAPTFSRRALMMSFYDTIVRSRQNVVYEAFSYEEYHLFLSLYREYFDSIEVIIIRRDSELIGVDGRELLLNTGYTTKSIQNNGTLDELYLALKSML